MLFTSFFNVNIFLLKGKKAAGFQSFMFFLST